MVAADAAQKIVRITLRTWIIGGMSWILLLLGTPIVSLAFLGCVGIALLLGAVVLGFLFVGGTLLDTRGSTSRYRVLGLLGLLAGMALILWSLWAPLGVFGYSLKAGAITRFHVSPPDSPSADMMLTLWWEQNSVLVLGALSIAGAALIAGGLRLLGETSKGWLLAAFVCSGATGPIVLAACLQLLNQGYRSWN